MMIPRCLFTLIVLLIAVPLSAAYLPRSMRTNFPSRTKTCARPSPTTTSRIAFKPDFYRESKCFGNGEGKGRLNHPDRSRTKTVMRETKRDADEYVTTFASEFGIESVNGESKTPKTSNMDDPAENSVPFKSSWKERFWSARPQNDQLDKTILATAIPSMINLAVVPIVNSVDTFWVGRMGDALALAGQAAANQAFFVAYFMVSFVPTITAPLVASAVGSGNDGEARTRVCESLFLCNLLGAIGTMLLVGFPRGMLGMNLPRGAPAMDYATPYLRWRGMGMIPALVSATGFAAYRGLLNTVTPLKVSLAANAINLVLDPLLIFTGGMGFVGAAFATSVAETVSGLTYVQLLIRRKLASWSLLIKPPSWKSLLPLLQGGTAMLARQMAINVGIVMAGRRAQSLDPTGVAAAAYGIVMQLYSVGIVIHVAIQGTAAAMVSSALTKHGPIEARRVADRLLVWGSITGMIMGLAQFLAIPVLVPMFSTLPQVQDAVRLPALLASLLHVINGPVFAGEGTMMGLGCYRDLAIITAGGIATRVALLAPPLGQTVEGILFGTMVFCILQAAAMLIHHVRFGPLALLRDKKN